MVASLARCLAQAGHEPHIFTFAPTGELRVEPERLLEESPHFLRVPPRDDAPLIDGVQIHYAPALPLLRSGYYFGVRYPVWMRSLLREMDILHVHHPFISGRLALRLRRDEQPIVFTNHTRYDIYSNYLQEMVQRSMQPSWMSQPWMTQPWIGPMIPPESLARRLTLRAARFANLCDAVVAPSESIRHVLQEWGIRAPLVTIPNGVDLSRFELQQSNVNDEDNAVHTSSTRCRVSTRNAMRRDLKIEADAPVALYLGRLAPEKNGRALLESFALARAQVARARLIVVGDGPSNEEWRLWAQEFGVENSVVFTGAVSARDVPALLEVADVFVSASVSEVHPLTFIEAMASGLPCVGTPSPGVCDMICDGKNGEARNGWLAEPSPPLFAQALIEALSNGEERARRGAQAREDSRNYAIERTVSGVLELYQNVLAGSSSVVSV